MELDTRASDSTRSAVIAYVWGTVAWAFVLAAAASVVAASYDRLGDVRAALRRLLPRLPGLAAATLLATLATFVGAIFLILPGILIAIWLSLVPQAIVIDQKSWGAALNRSYDLVRRRSLGVVLLLLGIVVLGAAVGYVAPVLLEPSEDFAFAWLGYVVYDVMVGSFVGVIFAVLYYHLLAVERDEPAPSFDFQ